MEISLITLQPLFLPIQNLILFITPADGIKDLQVVQAAGLDYPMALKDHGVDFALDNRHLWIRMQSQWAILRVRVRVMSAVREYLDGQGFFNLDTRCYEDGALDARTKEIAGLSASLVLRCDDCIAYHVIRCCELGVTKAEILEVFDVGLIVGGSIVIPHLRRAHELLGELLGEEA